MEKFGRRAESGVLINDIINIQSRVSVDIAKFADNISIIEKIVIFWAIRVSFEYLCCTESRFCFDNVFVKIQIFQNFLYLIFLIKIEIFVFW